MNRKGFAAVFLTRVQDFLRYKNFVQGLQQGIFTAAAGGPIIAHMDAPKPETLPVDPGVYLFKEASGKIIYVGKAKNLRKRLASYFANSARLTAKTTVMLGLARSVDTLCTATEKEALLLEASLIKTHRPRYNILLRDDKQYVLFKLDKTHDWPRLILTRRVARDGSLYYGPFTSALAAKEAMKAIQRVFPLRRCKDHVFANRTRPCLYHFMGSCRAPCRLPVPREEYQAMVRGVELLLSGRSGELTRQLKSEMDAAAKAMDFEAAAVLRDQIRAVEHTLERQAAVLTGREEDLDAVGLVDTGAGLALGLLFVRRGSLIDKKTFFWPNLVLEDAGEALSGFLAQFYGPGRFIPPKILLPWTIEDQDTAAEALSEMRGGPVRLATPRGELEKRLVSMAGENARQDAAIRENPPILPLIQGRLNLPREPQRIEAVDISHLSGHKPVAGQVVFIEGKQSKADYRLYNLDELEGAADDYAALAAYARRRLKSGPPWPDLLLVDGGRGQLSAVQRVLDEEAVEPIPLAGISKAREGGRTIRRHGDVQDQIFLPGRKNPVELRAGSPELLFLQNIRDCAHRFVLSRHRRSRKKKALEGELLKLPGVGTRTACLLWEHFPSLEAMAQAGIEELAALPGLGRKKAESLHQALQTLRKN